MESPVSVLMGAMEVARQSPSALPTHLPNHIAHPPSPHPCCPAPQTASFCCSPWRRC